MKTTKILIAAILVAFMHFPSARAALGGNSQHFAIRDLDSIFPGYSPLSKQKATICTITINSANEKKIFEQYLPQREGFQFVELVPERNSSTSSEGSGEGNWFDQACKTSESTGLKCDVLLVSGHFGGTFFGHSNYSLSMQDLERHGCRKDCDGIIANPAMALLFGCNTLAGKEADSRTPEVYLRDLLADGIPRADAERVVESRYGPTGDTNEMRMRRAFRGVPRIYGFSSRAPLGSETQAYLQKYFRQNPDFRATLERYRAEKSSTNCSASSDAIYRDPLLKVLREVRPWAECTSGVCGSNLPADVNIDRWICALARKEVSLSERLTTIDHAIRSDSAFLILPSAVDFFRANPPALYTGEALTIYRHIQQALDFRDHLRLLIEKTRFPLIKYGWASFANSLGWLSAEEMSRITDPLAADAFNGTEMTDEVVDIIAEIHRLGGILPAIAFRDIQPDLVLDVGFRRVAAYVTNSDFPSNLRSYLLHHAAGMMDPKTANIASNNDFFNDTESLLRVFPLEPSVRFFWEAYQGSLDRYERMAALEYLTDLIGYGTVEPLDTEMADFFVTAFREEKNRDDRFGLVRLIDSAASEDPRILRAVLELAQKETDDRLMQSELVQTLRHRHVRDPEILAAVRVILKTNSSIYYPEAN